MESEHYHPFDPQFRERPYPHYAALRREAPLHRVPDEPFVLVSRHADVLAALRQPGVFSSAPVRELIDAGVSLAGGDGVTGETLLGSDPPVHTRLRKIVNRGFLPRRVAALEPRVRELAGRLVGAFAERGRCELVRDLAAPLPVRVIAELLGVDAERHEDFKRWSDALMLAMTGRVPAEEKDAVERSFAELDLWLDEVVEARRREPGDDLVSALVHAGRDGEVMSESELGNFVVLLLVAGNETTTHLIANATLALVEHPDVLEAVRAEPGRVPELVEETLRFDPPAQLTFRRALRDAELPSGKVAEGETLVLLLASANRDEAVFEAPERFRLDRPERAHLAFGHGTHFCVGSHLARLEARVAFETLVPCLRVPRLLEPEPELEYAWNALLRGPRRLPLGFEPSEPGPPPGAIR